MKALIDWLLGRSPLGVIENWTPERAQKAERETLVRHGRVTDPKYNWHPFLLAAYKREQRRNLELSNVSEFRKRA